MTGVTRLERNLIVLVAAAAAFAGLAHFLSWTPLLRFGLATLALIGLAWLVTFATEQVSGHVGPAVTGVLQATIANLPELFVVIFALDAGELVVAETAIVGSMLANALLLLGLVIVVGSRRAKDNVMRFKKRLPNDTVTLLIVMLFAVVLGSPSLGADGAAHNMTIAVVSGVCLLIVYGVWLLPYLRGEQAKRPRSVELEPAGVELQPAGSEPQSSHGMTSRVSLPVAGALLLASGVGAAFVSDWFIDALKPAIGVLHISKAFAGLVIVALAGNAVEHAASVTLAARGHYDLAISVVKNSVAQIAGFLYPVLVIVSVALSTQITFALAPVYIGALALMTIAVWQVSGDGEAGTFEGIALIALYVIVAVVAAYL